MSITLGKRKKILGKANGLCAHCGKKLTLKTLTMDHIIPKSYFGDLHTDNLMPLCRKCNESRGNSPIIPNIYYGYANKDTLISFYIYAVNWQQMYKTTEIPGIVSLKL